MMLSLILTYLNWRLNQECTGSSAATALYTNVLVITSEKDVFSPTSMNKPIVTTDNIY